MSDKKYNVEVFFYNSNNAHANVTDDPVFSLVKIFRNVTKPVMLKNKYVIKFRLIDEKEDVYIDHASVKAFVVKEIVTKQADTNEADTKEAD